MQAAHAELAWAPLDHAALCKESDLNKSKVPLLIYNRLFVLCCDPSVQQDSEDAVLQHQHPRRRVKS